MSLRSLPFIRKLKQEDVTVLTAIERLMKTYNYVPIEDLPDSTDFSSSRIEIILTKLHRFRFIKRWSQAYEAVYLTFDGLDSLALYSLRNLNAVGPPIGIGKESRVFNGAYSSEDEEINVAVKLHRLERAFKATRRKRDYSKDRHHLRPIEESKIAAKKEYDALMRLYQRIRVPKPYAHNRHIVVMEKVIGDELSKVRQLEKETAKEIFESIIVAVRESFQCGLIHADLSEFNIIINEEHEPVLIDWPQWVDADHVDKERLLLRDISNICVYFSKKYDIYVPDPKGLTKLILQDLQPGTP
ncbi:MAG: RIO1 family regulatory kinase/ATPase [Promethearchaeota archaeon]